MSASFKEQAEAMIGGSGKHTEMIDKVAAALAFARREAYMKGWHDGSGGHGFNLNYCDGKAPPTSETGDTHD